ncbi:MAG: YihY/virulence factor BrkB family protein [Kiritimatiellia bacterium]
MQIIRKLVDFFAVDVWRIRAHALPRSKSFWIRHLRVILLAIRRFGEDKIQLRASALTYYSLLSIVPVVAMGFGIAKGFGYDKVLESQLITRLPGHEEVVVRIVEFSRTMLDNTRGGLIAGIGVAVLLWIVIKVLGTIEGSFNDIWGIKKGRSLARKFTDYLSIMLVCPIVFILTSSMTVAITAQATKVLQKIALLGAFAPLILTLLKLLPFCALWALFTFIYVFMPNTKVNFRSGLLGGIVAGTVYQFVQWIYITFQIGVSNYGIIYGSFAALPLFLVWLQMGWTIVLFGAEISFADQNVETYELEPDCLNASHSFKRAVAMAITLLCARAFREGNPALTELEIARNFELPIRLARQVLYELVTAGILIEAKVNENKVAYQPARDLGQSTLLNITQTLDDQGINSMPINETGDFKKIRSFIQEARDALDRSPANRPLKVL